MFDLWRHLRLPMLMNAAAGIAGAILYMQGIATMIKLMWRSANAESQPPSPR